MAKIQHHPKHHSTTPTQRIWVLSFFGAAIILLGAVLVLANGRSRIAFTWTPQPVEGKTTFAATSAPAENEVLAAFVQTTVNVERTFTADKSVAQPTPPPTTPTFTGTARGTVTIVNRYSKTQPLQAGTRLQTKDGLIFRTQQRVDVPAGGKINTEVVADVSGEKGALKTGTTFILPGLWAGLQDKIFAEVVEDFHGDSVNTGTPTLPGLTANELANAQQELLKEAVEKAAPELEKSIPTGRTLYPGLVNAAVTKRAGPAIGDQVASYTLKLTVQATGVALAAEGLNTLATQILENSVSADLQLTSLDAKNFLFTVSNVDAKKQRADVTLTARGTTVPTPTHALLQHSTYSGKAPDAVRSLLTKEEAVTNVTVELSPFWTRTIPSSKDDLQLEVTRAE